MAAKGTPSANPKIVEKIPFFRKLSLNQVKQVLHAGQMTTYDEGQMVCKDGDKSTAMYILLAGELAIKDGDTELARIRPVDIVGEMGLITNEPRCATIEAVKSATLLTIGKIHLEVLLKNDIDMALKVYKNMLDSLSQKLRDNNTRLTQGQSAASRQIAASVV